MPEYLSPAVYVEEIDTGSKPIEGVSTSTAGFLGVTERGPVNVPTLVTGIGDYNRTFGERLPPTIFRNANGPHCFMPEAVEGFFSNGGKRLFVTRVLDDAGALKADFTLHDRGTPSSVLTFLLRNAAEGTGTLGSGVPLYIVAPNLNGAATLNAGDEIRLGDGSASEYREVDNTGAAAGPTTHVPLDFPLSRSHVPPAAGALMVIPPNVVATFTIPAGQATAIGATSVLLNGTPPDIAALAIGDLLELGTNASLEYRFIRSITAIDAQNVRVRIDSGLMLAHAPTSQVRKHGLPAVVPDANLLLPASAGDRVVFIVPPVPASYVENAIVLFTPADTVNREARRIGALFSARIAGSSYGSYPAGSVVEPLSAPPNPTAFGDEVRRVATPLPNLTLNDPSLLAPGVTLLMGTGATAETATIASIDPVTNEITLAPAPTFAHPANDPVVPGFSLKQLTAASAAGATVIQVDNRQTLAVGDVIRIDVGANEEFATIAALPNQSATPPDDGPVILAQPLNLAHVGRTTTTPGASVRRETAPVVDDTKPASTLLFPTDQAGNLLILSHGTGYLSADYIRVTTPGGQIAFHQLTGVPAALTPEPITVSLALERRHVAGSVLTQRNRLALVEALDAGMWGNRLRISAEDEPTGLVARTTLTFVNGTTQIRLASAAGVESGTILEILDPDNDDAVIGDPLKVDYVDRTANYLINLAAPGLSPAQQAAIAAATTPLGVHSREFRLTVWLLHQPDPARPQRNEVVIDSEMFRNLSMDDRHSRYFQMVIGDTDGPLRLSDRRPEGESEYVRVHDLAQDLVGNAKIAALHGIRLGPEALIDILPTGRERAARHPLEGGDDSIATMDDALYSGSDDVQPELRKGLFTFVNVDDISIVAVPGRTSADMQAHLIEHCELMRYRFAVLDSVPPPNDSIPDVQFQRQQFDTKYAALYYPWILIPDPFPTNLANVANIPIPPSGHVVGIYARTDIERGVHKAPANEVVRGIVGLQRIINYAEQDLLNPYPVNINVIRDFRPNNRGLRVWGARVITSDSDWKYVNVRRLLIFIEKSIERGLQWVVFEPNAEPLWARVVRTISNFLTIVWRNGALEGVKKEEAFYVKCDRTTMTQTDIDSGRLICVIGVAPVKPAEFVIIRIGLWTAHTED